MDATGPLEGYRCWAVGSWSPSLSSIVAISVVWEPDGPTCARCYAMPGIPGYPRDVWDASRAAPDIGCTCGLWVLRRIDAGLMRRTAGIVPSSLRMALYVWGRVRFWGEVIEHEHGWRAEFARPVALYRTWEPFAEARMREVAEAYDIPIEDAPPELLTWGLQRDDDDTARRQRLVFQGP